jgi:hypothetical protein
MMAEPQVFHPYTAWEDWRAGMWQVPSGGTAEMERAAQILGDPDLFLDAARTMLADWPNAAEQNLTDMAQNRRAWVGQATCCHLAGIAEQATRLAWWTLTAVEQYAANQAADQAITEWLIDRENDRNPGLFAIELPTQRTGEGVQVDA